MSKTAKIILLILVIAGVGYGFYRWYQANNKKTAPQAPAHVPDPVVPGNKIVSDISNGTAPDISRVSPGSNTVTDGLGFASTGGAVA